MASQSCSQRSDSPRLATLVAGESKVIDVMDGLLTLKGLCLIYKKNAG